MKKHAFYSFLLLGSLLLLNSCSKNDDDEQTDSQKVELLTKSAWKFDKATAPVYGDISSYLEACLKDNTISFTATAATAGTGVVDEGPTKCNTGDPQTTSFDWTLQSDGTKLVSSKPLFAGGSGTFDLVSLSATTMVISQEMTIPPAPATTVTVTLKH